MIFFQKIVPIFFNSFFFGRKGHKKENIEEKPFVKSKMQHSFGEMTKKAKAVQSQVTFFIFCVLTQNYCYL